MYNSLLKKNQCFPICHLNGNIISMLHNLKSIDWLNLPKEGLQKGIKFEDLNGPIKNIASLDLGNNIHLSAAYCQFLWSICYVASKTYDCNNVQQEIEGFTTEEIKQFKRELEIGKNEGIVKELISYLDSTDVFQKCHIVFEKGSSLIKDSVEISGFNQFYEIPNVLDSDNYKVNAIYCYAVIFILCHEIGHFSLNHPIITTKQDEESADDFSFWTLYSDVSKEEKISAMIGTLTGLCSLLFFSKELTGDEQHPNEDERIISSLSIIRDEYPHYIGFVLQIFKMWAYYFQISNFLDNANFSNNREALDAVLSFVEARRKE